MERHTDTYDTIVIGLGAAGVTALTTLAKHGRTVLGLEAQDRIGGRVHTVNCRDGVLELGAEWIHGIENSLVYETARTLNITTIRQDLSMDVYHSDGSHGNKELFVELMTVYFELLENRKEKVEPFGQYVERELKTYIKKNHPELLRNEHYLLGVNLFMNLFTNNHEASNDWKDITTSSKYEELKGHLYISWHKYGYKTLFEVLMNKHNNSPGLPYLDIKLNSPVTKISYTRDPHEFVTVSCGDVVYKASNVIVTVSIGVLKECHETLFSPKLPLKKIKAIENISFGVMDKIILEFPKPFWPKHVQWYAFIWDKEDIERVSERDYWTTRIFGASRCTGSTSCLTLWTSGEVAKIVETLPKDEVRVKSLYLIRKFMGKHCDVPEPINVIRSKWYSNKYTRGSYTFDSMDNVMYPTLRSDLAEPILGTDNRPKLLFAGEATNLIHFSTVHGAMESGITAANEILGCENKL